MAAPPSDDTLRQRITDLEQARRLREHTLQALKPSAPLRRRVQNHLVALRLELTVARARHECAELFR